MNQNTRARSICSVRSIDCPAIGSIVIAGMVKTGYSRNFAAGVICNAGTLGILIPPSIVMVVYAAATESSVGRLFMAGIIPGLVLGGMLMGAILIAAIYLRLPREPWPGFWPATRNVLVTARDAFWGLALIIIVLGGIYGSVMTPTEAAAVAAVYACFAALVLYRDLKIIDVPRVLVNSGRVTIMLLFIIANAFLFSHVLTTEQNSAGDRPPDRRRRPQLVAVPHRGQRDPADRRELHGAVLDHPDPGAHTVPNQLGIDPIHLGIIMVVNMEIGMVTPPVGSTSSSLRA